MAPNTFSLADIEIHTTEYESTYAAVPVFCSGDLGDPPHGFIPMVNGHVYLRHHGSEAEALREAAGIAKSIVTN